MTFYLKPPRGDIALDKLEELAIKRWNFLQLLLESSQRNLDDVTGFHETLSRHSELSESVMENSPKDRVSHFFLRLVIAKINDYATKDMFLKSETCLFSYRMTENSRSDLAKSLADVVRHIDQLETEDEEFDVLSESIVTMLRQNIFDDDHETKPDLDLKVPFYIVPTLVASRQVQLDHGWAKIDALNARNFLSCVFSKMLRSSLTNMSETHLAYGTEEDDQRISVLIKRIKSQVSVQNRTSADPIVRLRAHEINEKSVHFPPCYTRVHHRLNQTHRLGHHARIAYTLFLKEIGLPLEEALTFWRYYYSKNPVNHEQHQKCGHSWQENSRKFEYSINHLYGNAGSRKNYSAHSCAAIAERSSSVNEELTCPFIDADIEDLEPTKQCCNHLQMTYNKHVSKSSSQSVVALSSKVSSMIVKPSHYFQEAMAASMTAAASEIKI